MVARMSNEKCPTHELFCIREWGKMLGVYKFVDDCRVWTVGTRGDPTPSTSYEVERTLFLLYPFHFDEDAGCVIAPGAPLQVLKASQLVGDLLCPVRPIEVHDVENFRPCFVVIIPHDVGLASDNFPMFGHDGRTSWFGLNNGIDDIHDVKEPQRMVWAPVCYCVYDTIWCLVRQQLI